MLSIFDQKHHYLVPDYIHVFLNNMFVLFHIFNFVGIKLNVLLVQPISKVHSGWYVCIWLIHFLGAFSSFVWISHYLSISCQWILKVVHSVYNYYKSIFYVSTVAFLFNARIQEYLFCWVCCCMPVVADTQEAEVGGSWTEVSQSKLAWDPIRKAS
jgi:hypothetical protein